MNRIKLISVNLGLLLFFALHPYPRWFMPEGLFQIVFLFTTTISSIELRRNIRKGLVVDKYRIGICIAAVTFLLFFTTPIVHDFRIGHFAYFLIFIQIIFFNDIIFYNSYKFLKKLFIIISVFAIVFWVLNAMGVPLIYYKCTPAFRTESVLDNYRIYGPVLSLYRGNMPIGGGIERICGVFAEPGHFGIYIGLMLAIEKFNFYEKRNLLLLITGFLTFSTAFYGIFCLGVLYKLLKYKRITTDIIRIVAVLFFTAITLLFFSDRFVETIYGRVVENKREEVSGVGDLLDNRVPDSHITKFESFIHSHDALVGLGYDNDEMVGTNWRGVVYRFGIIGTVIMLLLIFSIARKGSMKYGFLLAAIALLIVAHRAYLMFSPAIYMMLLTAVYVNRTKESFIIKIEGLDK